MSGGASSPWAGRQGETTCGLPPTCTCRRTTGPRPQRSIQSRAPRGVLGLGRQEGRTKSPSTQAERLQAFLLHQQLAATRLDGRLEVRHAFKPKPRPERPSLTWPQRSSVQNRGSITTTGTTSPARRHGQAPDCRRVGGRCGTNEGCVEKKSCQRFSRLASTASPRSSKACCWASGILSQVRYTMPMRGLRSSNSRLRAWKCQYRLLKGQASSSVLACPCTDKRRNAAPFCACSWPKTRKAWCPQFHRRQIDSCLGCW